MLMFLSPHSWVIIRFRLVLRQRQPNSVDRDQATVFVYKQVKLSTV